MIGKMTIGASRSEKDEQVLRERKQGVYRSEREEQERERAERTVKIHFTTNNKHASVVMVKIPSLPSQFDGPGCDSWRATYLLFNVLLCFLHFTRNHT